MKSLLVLLPVHITEWQQPGWKKKSSLVERKCLWRKILPADSEEALCNITLPEGQRSSMPDVVSSIQIQIANKVQMLSRGKSDCGKIRNELFHGAWSGIYYLRPTGYVPFLKEILFFSLSKKLDLDYKRPRDDCHDFPREIIDCCKSRGKGQE